MRSTRLFLSTVSILCAGCSRAPSINVLGSFFPAWMVCIIASIAVTFVVRYALLKFQLETEVGHVAIFYPCLVIFVACGLWLIFFR